jgi:hypothetical protein
MLMGRVRLGRGRVRIDGDGGEGVRREKRGGKQKEEIRMTI